MNGKKARTIRRVWGVKHIHLISWADRPFVRYTRRETRWGKTWF